MVRVIGVTSCATGIAHSYMAAEAIEKLCKKQGISVKIEIQGALGIENELSSRDVANANLIIFANDVAINRFERFNGSEEKIVNVSPHSVIQKPECLMDVMRERGLLEG